LTFSRKTNCSECGYPLYLQDINSCNWKGDVQEFVFVCSSCKSENVIKKKLFDQNGHIKHSYLAVMKENSSYLSGEQLEQVSKHLSECEHCKKCVDENLLDDVEEKMKMNDLSFRFFQKNGTELKEKIMIAESKIFQFENETFQINEQDEFYRKNGNGMNVCYYMRQDSHLTGMACVRTIDGETFLTGIWLKPKEQIKQEKEFFERLRNGEKLKLDTLKQIFQAISK
jgi:hypothetical protein